MNRSIFRGAAVAALGVLAACSSAPEPMAVSLQATEFQYGPKTIEAAVGQQVTVALVNGGTVEHDFVILEIPLAEPVADSGEADEMAGHNMGELEMQAAVHGEAMPGVTGSVAFTPTQAGTYEFFCAVAGHKEAGMVGTLIVR